MDGKLSALPIMGNYGYPNTRGVIITFSAQKFVGVLNDYTTIRLVSVYTFTWSIYDYVSIWHKFRYEKVIF